MNSIIRKLLDYLLIIPVSIIPQRFLSSQVHRLAQTETIWFKSFLLRWFCRVYKVDLSEAIKSELDGYKSFNEFFTRKLKPEARPITPGAGSIISPADGLLSQSGMIKHDLLYQAKAYYYSLRDLLTDSELADSFIDGQFATIYLAPRDYHRVHMPLDGKLQRILHVPGRLWPVNPPSVRRVSSLFTRNERVILEFDTEYGKMALIMVGALFVGSITTIFTDKLTPPYQNAIKIHDYSEKVNQGMEIGRFNLGSTVIMLLAANAPRLNIQEAQSVQMGEKLS